MEFGLKVHSNLFSVSNVVPCLMWSQSIISVSPRFTTPDGGGDSVKTAAATAACVVGGLLKQKC